MFIFYHRIKMKTIQISDETYDFLVNLAQEMKTQNNR
nr:MAG TPA: SeqA protein N-terminal domain [Caudoviricetes sp.]DAN25666.1 MAG TPA: SeqA protein N-terminal domain [Bacteriophage sp.]DAR62887.1 MAG TPA: SeqA protein N-terminal domain [Caudoviricetes sp.]